MRGTLSKNNDKKIKNNYKGKFNKMVDKPNKDKSIIKCFCCDKIGHSVNE